MTALSKTTLGSEGLYLYADYPGYCPLWMKQRQRQMNECGKSGPLFHLHSPGSWLGDGATNSGHVFPPQLA